MNEMLMAAPSRNGLTLRQTGSERGRIAGHVLWARGQPSSGKQGPPCSHDKHVALLGMQRHTVKTYEGVEVQLHTF